MRNAVRKNNPDPSIKNLVTQLNARSTVAIVGPEVKFIFLFLLLLVAVHLVLVQSS
jgi:hypothetical protein